MPAVQPESGLTQGRVGVYRIFNTATGASYVGSTKSIRSRINGHIRSLRTGRHCNPKLQNAWDKYGEDAWVFSILEYCPPADLVRCEQDWVARLDTIGKGYNLQEPGDACYGSKGLGRVTSEETRKRLSVALKGRRPKMTPARKSARSRSYL